MGILWCNSDNFNRAQIMFELLNPATKPYRFFNVTINDPIFEEVFTIIIELATVTLVNDADLTRKLKDQNLRKRIIDAMLFSKIDKPRTKRGLIPLIFEN